MIVPRRTGGGGWEEGGLGFYASPAVPVTWNRISGIGNIILAVEHVFVVYWWLHAAYFWGAGDEKSRS